jgi:hypothetical protein
MLEDIVRMLYILQINGFLKSKAISVTGRGGLEGCEMLRIPRCLDNRLTDGGKVVSPTITILDIFHRPVFYLKLHWTL